MAKGKDRAVALFYPVVIGAETVFLGVLRVVKPKKSVVERNNRVGLNEDCVVLRSEHLVR